MGILFGASNTTTYLDYGAKTLYTGMGTNFVYPFSIAFLAKITTLSRWNSVFYQSNASTGQDALSIEFSNTNVLDASVGTVAVNSTLAPVVNTYYTGIIVHRATNAHDFYVFDMYGRLLTKAETITTVPTLTSNVPVDSVKVGAWGGTAADFYAGEICWLAGFNSNLSGGAGLNPNDTGIYSLVKYGAWEFFQKKHPNLQFFISGFHGMREMVQGIDPTIVGSDYTWQQPAYTENIIYIPSYTLITPAVSSGTNITTISVPIPLSVTTPTLSWDLSTTTTSIPIPLTVPSSLLSQALNYNSVSVNALLTVANITASTAFNVVSTSVNIGLVVTNPVLSFALSLSSVSVNILLTVTAPTLTEALNLTSNSVPIPLTVTNSVLSEALTLTTNSVNVLLTVANVTANGGSSPTNITSIAVSLAMVIPNSNVSLALSLLNVAVSIPLIVGNSVQTLALNNIVNAVSMPMVIVNPTTNVVLIVQTTAVNAGLIVTNSTLINTLNYQGQAVNVYLTVANISAVVSSGNVLIPKASVVLIPVVQVKANMLGDVSTIAGLLNAPATISTLINQANIVPDLVKIVNTKAESVEI